MTGNLLEVRDLKVVFDVHGGMLKAVDGISFRVRPGDTVAIVGESGSGKSVTAQAIMGILPDAARIAGGEILFRDPTLDGAVTDIAKLAPESAAMRALRGGRISIIFQEPMTSLSPLHTIGDQIGEALHLHRKVAPKAGLELVEQMLRLVGFPDPKRAIKTYPFELSGGLRQRAMIAMALICRPALLVADEPTTALDVTIQAQILKLVNDLQAELGMALLIITHDLGVVANVAREVVVMYGGKVMEAGPVEDIFRRASHPYLKALLHAVPRFHMQPGERLVPIREIKSVTGHLMAEKEPWPEAGDAAGPILSVQGISKSYAIRKSGFFGTGPRDSLVAVDDVSFDVHRGECLGLVGESGCGKTTISKVVMRALLPDSGRVLFNDRGRVQNLLDLHGNALIPYRRKMQYVFQDPYSSLNPRMTVLESVSEPLTVHNIGDAATRLEMVRELMALVGLDVRHLNRYPHSFSGGQRQRIGIARALALKPDLLLCDEPVSALDVSVQAQILNLLKDLQKNLGLTYLFISHNLAVIDYMADRIAVMCRGRLVELAPREVLFRSPVHPYTQGLLAAVPDPDLDNRLDFRQLMEDRASDPAAWPAPFTIDGKTPAALREIDSGHFVRCHRDWDMRRLAA